MDLIKEIGFKPKSLGIAFDPAHGKNVSGKASPDGKHKEYRWSRETIEQIFDGLKNTKSNLWDLSSPFLTLETEPGLRNRVNVYNELSQDYDLLIVLSLHNDAFKNPPAWWSGPGGFTFFTSRGETHADPICTMIGNEFKNFMPNERFRFDYGLAKNEKVRDLDREANFTVITGYDLNTKHPVLANYAGILIENGFMDVKSDYLKLQTPKWNLQLIDTYIISTMVVATELGFDSLIKPIRYETKR